MKLTKLVCTEAIILSLLLLLLCFTQICTADCDLVKSLALYPIKKELLKTSNGLPKEFLNTIYEYGDSIFVGTDGQGVYRIKEGEASWQPFNIDELADAKVRVFHLKGEYLYIGTNKGVFRAGANDLVTNNAKPPWERVGKLGLKNKELLHPGHVGFFLNDVTALSSAYDCLFVGTAGGGVFRLKDKEENWDWIKTAATNYVHKIPFNGLHYDGGYLYAAIDSEDFRRGIYRMEYDSNKMEVGENPYRPLLFNGDRVRVFIIITELDGTNLYAAIGGIVSKVKLKNWETKVILDYKDRVITHIYADNDSIYFLNPKGWCSIPKNLGDKTLTESRCEEFTDSGVISLFKGYGFDY